MQISRIRLARTHSLRGMHWFPSSAAELELGSVRRCHSVIGFPQAVLLPSSGPRVRQGPFAPRELPRFIATTAPSDSRLGRPAVMVSRRSLIRIPDHQAGSLKGCTRRRCRVSRGPRSGVRPTGVPRRSRWASPRGIAARPTLPPSRTRSQVPDRSVDARCPVPPRRIRPLQTLIALRPIAGFTFSGRLAIPICVTRPRGFARATADVFASPGSDGRVASVAAGSASW